MRILVANSLRRAGRQIVLLCAASATVVLVVCGARPHDGNFMNYLFASLVIGCCAGPILWLLYRFARFLIGPSTRSLT